MIFVLGECDKNCFLASRVYRQRYPELRHPKEACFKLLIDRFSETGSVSYRKHTRPPVVLTEENEEIIMTAVVENPHISTRELSRNHEISRTTIRRILKKNKFHPYHFQLHQELLPRDFIQRRRHCTWLINKINNDRHFLNKILYSDEATFHRNGTVNRHNYHYYSDENPHLSRSTSQQRWSLNVWGGIIDNYVIGPFFFEGRVNGPIFLHFLHNNFRELIRNVPLNIINTMWLQLDGAPIHFSAMIRQWIDEEFGERWIGRGGPVRWPARSPDLTPCDFFLWGYVKDKVYTEPVTTKEDMQLRIRRVFSTISPTMLQNVRRSIKTRARKCIEQNGRHFEHLLK